MGERDDVRIRLRYETRDAERDLGRVDEGLRRTTDRAARTQKQGSKALRRAVAGAIGIAAGAVALAAPGTVQAGIERGGRAARFGLSEFFGRMTGRTGEDLRQGDIEARAQMTAGNHLAGFVEQAGRAGFVFEDRTLQSLMRQFTRVQEAGLQQRERVEVMLQQRSGLSGFQDFMGSLGDLLHSLFGG